MKGVKLQLLGLGLIITVAGMYVHDGMSVISGIVQFIGALMLVIGYETKTWQTPLTNNS